MSRTLSPALLSLSLLVLSPAVHADVFVVGSGGAGAGCTHSSLQAAINASTVTAGTDVIKVTNSLTYTNQALSIQNQSLYVLGRWLNCAATQREAPRTVLSGNNSAPVWTISGTGNVTIDGFEVTGGNTGVNASGGGLRLTQSGGASVTLQDMTIHNNNADFGGGIAIHSEAATPGAGPLLVLGPDLSVQFNHSRAHGGGVYCRGARVQGNNTAIELAFNTAAGNGGGVYGQNCDLELSSPGGVFGALFAFNSAHTGGGLALFNATARVFTHQPAAPLRFTGNAASLGGAIAVVDQSQFTGYETRFDNNRAYEAAGAIYQYNGLVGGLNRVILLRQRGSGLGVGCSAPECGTLSGNRALSLDDEERVGAVLRAVSSGDNGIVETVFAGQELFDNVGNTLLRGNETTNLAGTQRLVLENSLVHHNQVGYIGSGASGADFAVINSTIADNGPGGDTTFSTGANAQYPNKLRIRNSIIAQGAGSQLTGSNPPELDIAWLAIQNGTGLGSIPTVFVTSPGFVDPALRDYRLGMYSTLRDFAPREPGTYSDERDLLGATRDRDLPPIVNYGGAQDLGAIEADVALLPPEIFSNGFEAPEAAYTSER